MIAYNLGHDYQEAEVYGEAVVWYRIGADAARALLGVMPGDRQLWYMHGMCCANQVEIAHQQEHRPAPLALHREGLASLEKALEMRAADSGLRSDLGVCWEFYAADLAGAGEPAAALAAQGRAAAYQAGAVLAAPGEPSFRGRLRSHLAGAVRLTARVWLDAGERSS